MIPLAVFVETILLDICKTKKKTVNFLQLSPLCDYLQENDHKLAPLFESVYRIALLSAELKKEAAKTKNLLKSFNIKIPIVFDKCYKFKALDDKIILFRKLKWDHATRNYIYDEKPLSELTDEEIVYTLIANSRLPRSVREQIAIQRYEH